MIVFDLRCSQDHVFEAWFGSTEDYEDQAARGLVACPICDDRAVEKAVMAPAVGTKGNRQIGDSARKDELRTLALMQAEVEAKCDYVGDRFADNANTTVLPGYARVDARAGYRWQHWEAQFGMENLFDTHYYVSATGASQIMPGSPRQVNLTTSYRF